MTLMDENDYYDILKEAVCEKILRYGIVTFFLVVFGSYFCYRFFKTNKEMKTADKNKLVYLSYRKKKAEAAFGAAIIGIVLCISLTIPFSNDAKNDLSKKQFVVVQAEYRRSAATSRGGFVHDGYAILKIDGKNKSFDLPFGWTPKAFPEGEYDVIACYAKDTEILLTIEIID